MTAPCKGCEKRHEACHSSCPEYAEWKAWLEEGKQKRRDENSIHTARFTSAIAQMERERKRTTGRKKSRFYE